mgnify:CR=1 FL=1
MGCGTGRLAATETAQAFQYANYQAAAATGQAITRTWHTAPVDACPICQPLNGYTIRFDAKYPEGLEPGSAHPACRCSESYGTIPL